MQTAGRQRILVIDDDPLVRNALRALLEKAGYAVTLSSSAVEGIEWAESERFDAVLTDMNLPGLDGLEAVKAIARAVPPIPIIAMSGGSASQTVDDYSVLALRFGARRFLQKPFDREHLLAALKDIIDPEPA